MTINPAVAIFDMAKNLDSFWLERAISDLQNLLGLAKERETAARMADDRRIAKLLAQWEVEDKPKCKVAA